MKKPNPGCMIMITTAIVFLLLLIWASYTGYKQNKAIDAFTSPTAQDFGQFQASPEEVRALKKRLRAFGAAVKKPGLARLELSVQDLNTLVQYEEKLFDYRALIRFTGISQTLDAKVSLPLRTILRRGAYRYLNGTMRLAPGIKENHAVLETQEITSSQGPIPAGFAGSFAANFVPQAGYRDDPEIGLVLGRITRFALEDGKLILERSGEPPGN